MASIKYQSSTVDLTNIQAINAMGVARATSKKPNRPQIKATLKKRTLDFMTERRFVVSPKAWADLEQRLAQRPRAIPALQALRKDIDIMIE